MTAVLDRGTSPSVRPGEKQPSPLCPLTQVPAEVILLVTDILPPTSQMIFAQTSRRLWAISHRYVKHRKLKLNLECAGTKMSLGRDKHLEYLTCLVRGDPKLWLCDSCRRVRHVTDHVLARKDDGCCVRSARSVSFPELELQYHHVQLALKASRIGDGDPACQNQLRHLLAPHHSTQWCPNPQDDLTVLPRIVAGKFLILCTWNYAQGDPDTPVTLESVGGVSVCVHLTANGDPYAKGDPTLASAVDAAMAMPDGGEVCGSCPMCATDFAVEASARHMRLRCWRNLGAEGSPQDPEWRAQVDSITKERNRQPGRVRELYEGEE